MDGTLRVQAPRGREEPGGSHYQSTDGFLRVGEHALAKAEVINAASDVGVKPCRSDRRFEQATSWQYGGRRIVLDCIGRGKKQLSFG